MTKKSLKGLIKTKHFRERQKERRVSDQEIIEAITHGTLSITDSGQNYLLGSLSVAVNLDNELLITVHPGDPAGKFQKIMSKELAFKIRLALAAQKAKAQAEETDEEAFQNFVKEFSIKKL